MPNPKRLGEILVELGVITRAEAECVASAQSRRGDLVKFLPHLDLFALSSFTEGLPVAVLEAMAAGVPVVATAVGGTPEVVEEGVCGRLVPPGDPGALAQRLKELLANDGDLQVMGERGRQRVREHFTFVAQAEQYQRLFQKLLASVEA